MADYTINYTCKDRTLSVLPVNSQFEIIDAAIGGHKLSAADIAILVERVRETYPSIVSTTPKKLFPPSEPDSSPSCVIGSTEPVKMLFDSDFINRLRHEFFSSDITPSHAEPDEHIPILLSIEGNIGAGKSTLLKELRKLHPDWTFIDEPVETWTQLRNEKGNLLENFYADQDRWAYTFQNCSILSRYQLIENAIKENRDKKLPGKHIYITERSLGTDFHVFTKMLRADQKLDGHEYELYERWLAHLNEMSSTPLAALIFVDTPPQVCADRIRHRNREGEEGIPMAYLEQLEEYQSRWINSASIPCVRTTSLDEIAEFVDSLVA